MRVCGVSDAHTAERHVQFSEMVQVKYFTPENSDAPTQSTSSLCPSTDAMIIESRLNKVVPISPRVINQPPMPEAANEPKINPVKKILSGLSTACGLAVLPTVCLGVFLGPIGLVVPAALVVGCLAFHFLSR